MNQTHRVKVNSNQISTVNSIGPRDQLGGSNTACCLTAGVKIHRKSWETRNFLKGSCGKFHSQVLAIEALKPVSNLFPFFTSFILSMAPRFRGLLASSQPPWLAVPWHAVPRRPRRPHGTPRDGARCCDGIRKCRSCGGQMNGHCRHLAGGEIVSWCLSR